MRTKAILQEYRAKSINFKVAETPKELFSVTAIFQKQLPKMPKEYIFRQVFDPKHKNLLLYRDTEIIGSICYRSFYDLNFVEIVFCAIDSNVQIRGYGNFMMNCFKEHVKCEYWYNQVKENNDKEYTNKKSKVEDTEIMDQLYTLQHGHFEAGPNELKANQVIGLGTKTFYADSETYFNPPYGEDILYLMTYADNYAIGYFKKNGFSTRITFKNWKNSIKDYDGGTMMQSKIIPKINYIMKEEFIEDLETKALEKLKTLCDMNVYEGVDPRAQNVKGLENVHPTDLLCKSDINYVIKFLLSDLQNHPSAWPFLQPVKQNEVPDYYIVIKNPIDLSSMQKRMEKNDYDSISSFVSDFNLMVNNCYTYNLPVTQYHKCAQNLEEFFYKRKASFDRE